MGIFQRKSYIYTPGSRLVGVQNRSHTCFTLAPIIQETEH